MFTVTVVDEIISKSINYPAHGPAQASTSMLSGPDFGLNTHGLLPRAHCAASPQRSTTNMAEEVAVASLASKVESLSVSDEVKQIPARGGRKSNEAKQAPRAKESSERKEKGGDADSNVLQEPRIRSEHDNRFNYPNRTFSRDGGRGRGTDRGDNRGSDRDDWGRGRGRDNKDGENAERDRDSAGRNSGNLRGGGEVGRGDTRRDNTGRGSGSFGRDDGQRARFEFSPFSNSCIPLYYIEKA